MFCLSFMDFDGLRKIIDKIDRYGVDRRDLMKAEMDNSGQGIFDTSRLKFVVDHKNEISGIFIYGLQMVKNSYSCENHSVFYGIADKNGIEYSDMALLIGAETGRGKSIKYLSFMATPRIDIEGDVEKCVQKIYDAQNDLIGALSGGGMMATVEGGMKEEADSLAKNRVKKGNMGGRGIYDRSFTLPDGLTTTVGARLLELGDERRKNGGISWKDVCSQLNREAGVYTCAQSLVQKYGKMKGLGIGETFSVDKKKTWRRGRRGYSKNELIVNGKVVTVEKFAYDMWVEKGNRGTGNKGRLCWSGIAEIVNKEAGLNLSIPSICEMTYKYRNRVEQN